MELRWTVLHCGVVGIVDRVDHVPQFTAFHIRARLGVSAETNEQLAKRAVEKAERGCLIANSLKPPVQLETTIEGLEPAQMV
jgi:organic hydroperoxide reductase OsmC/OhrA